MELEQFTERLQSEWNIRAKSLRIPKKTPLSEWACPRLIEDQGASLLNWAVWIPELAAHSAGLQELFASDPGFFLWRLPRPAHADPDVRRVTGASLNRLATKLGTLSISQLLRDEAQGEPRRPLFKTPLDARAKLNDATHVFEREHFEGASAIAVISPRGVLKRAMQNGNVGCLRLDRIAQGRTVVFLDVLVSSDCPDDLTGTHMVDHVQSVFPEAMIVVCCPPCLSTLAFYHQLGFCYSPSAAVPSLLPPILDRLESATQCWHSGFPLLTYVDGLMGELPLRISTWNTAAYTASELMIRARHARHIFAPTTKLPSTNGAKESHVWVWIDEQWTEQNVTTLVEVVLEALEEVALFECTLVFADEDAMNALAAARPRCGNRLLLDSPRLEPDLEEDEMDVDVPVDDVSYVPFDVDDVPYVPFDVDEPLQATPPKTSPPKTSPPKTSPLQATPPKTSPLQATPPKSPASVRPQSPENRPSPAVTLDAPWYASSGALRRRVAVQVLRHYLVRKRMAFHRHTASMRSLLAPLLGVNAQDLVGTRALMLTQEKRLVGACVFRKQSSSISIEHVHCPVSEYVDLLAFVLRLAWANASVTGARECTTVLDLVQSETLETLFERAIPTEARIEFVKQCLVKGGVSVCE